MATRRRTRRKSSSRRTLRVVNPRRRRASTTKRKRTTTTRRRRTNPRKRRTTTRRRASTKRKRTTTRRRRTTTRRRSNPRKPKVQIRYRYRSKPKRKSTRKRRRANPKLKLFSSLKKGFGAIFGALPSALFGALSVEPTMWVAQLAAMIPGLSALPSSMFYGAAGLLSAGVVTAGGFLLNGLFPGMLALSTIKLFASATAAAAGGVGYYKWRTGQDTDVASEMGLLTMSGVGPYGLLTASPLSGMLAVQPQAAMGDPGAYYVAPMGNY